VARVTLRTVGALEWCKTLPSELDLEEVANMDLMNNESRRGVVRQLLKVLEHLGTEPELARALKEALEEALEKSSEASETGTEGAERQRFQQLSLAQKKLERTAPG
jgi:predicted nuclease with TOPRIM domain